MQTEATYLLWLDCRRLSTNGKALDDIFIHQLKLGLNNGIEFGQTGEGFMRMNVACPRATLENAMQRLLCLH
jgi:cystathionine beta-lyase